MHCVVLACSYKYANTVEEHSSGLAGDKASIKTLKLPIININCLALHVLWKHTYAIKLKWMKSGKFSV